jgi:hypothetical protein
MAFTWISDLVLLLTMMMAMTPNLFIFVAATVFVTNVSLLLSKVRVIC